MIGNRLVASLRKRPPLPPAYERGFFSVLLPVSQHRRKSGDKFRI